MPRYKLTIEYDGADFVGWQRQDNGLSVQEVIERAVKGYCQVDVLVQGAGRTDSGVHALGQVAHVDLPREDAPYVVANALNAHLSPYPVVIIKAEFADNKFHARFSAIERSYEYRIQNRRARPALQINRSWWISSHLDVETMHNAAQCLIGRHDFSTFRAAVCQSESPVKTLNEISVTRRGELVLLRARARSFLHHQVRNIVGTLKLVGEGKWRESDVAKALEARDRTAGGPTAPAEGLYLIHVGYPDA
ncbi:MAG: tRNA pseudouridine(38-40) synthase TruA [Candidatus Marinimicrobia bacterium]|nr:tRNA pseudouridine(38-40) synthase TruA [Candidatus Neomarinimicrobiota bacterium]